MKYDAFISYSHSADSDLAPALQAVLQKIAKPWYKKRGLNIFLDETDLSVAPNLWSKIETALLESKYFILLASPESSFSNSVKREIECFLNHNSANNIIIVLTDGEIVWNNQIKDFDWDKTNALPKTLKGVFCEEPLYLDLIDFQSMEEHLAYENSEFRNKIASIAATIYGITVKDLIGEEIRQYRKTASIRNAVIIALSTLLILALASAWNAYNQKSEADRQLIEANHNLGLTLLSKSVSDLQRHNYNSAKLNSLYALKYLKEGANTNRRLAISNVLNTSDYPIIKTIPDGSHHQGKVSSVCFSPNGKILASGSDDNTIKLWDVSTGNEIATLCRHTNGVTSICFSPNGKILASGSWDETIILWDVERREAIATLFGHSSVVNTVGFSPDGKVLASGSSDETIKLWDVETHKDRLTFEIEGYRETVETVSFSPDGKFLAAGTDNGDIKIWDLEKRTEFATLKDNHDGILSICFSPDGKLIASGNFNEIIKLWNVKTGKVATTIQGHSELVRSVCFSPNGKILASGSETIKLWDVESGNELEILQGHTNSVLSVDFSPDGKKLASGSFDETIKLWEVETGKEITTNIGHTGIVGSAIFSPDGKILASGSRTIKLFDWLTGKEIQSFHGDIGNISKLMFLPSGKCLAAANDYEVILFDKENGKEIKRIEGNPQGEECFAFFPNGEIIASGQRSYEGIITLWDMKSGQKKVTFGEHRGEVNTLSFSPNGEILASGSGSEYRTLWPELNSIKLWDTKTGKELKTLYGKSGPITVLEFSPDGKILASGSFDGTIKLWDIIDFKEIRTFSGHVNRINSICFSTDGKVLASGSDDNKVKIFDIEKGTEIVTLTGHTKGVASVHFSSDNKTLATGGKDKTVKIWDISNIREGMAFQQDSISIGIASLSPNLRLLASVSEGLLDDEKIIALHDVPSGKIISKFPNDVYNFMVKFSPDGKILTSISDTDIDMPIYFKNELIKMWSVVSFEKVKTIAVPCCINDISISADMRFLALATGSDIRRLARRIKIYDLKTDLEIVEFPREDDFDHSLAFSPDGRFLASGSDDKKIILWNLDKKEKFLTLLGHTEPVTIVNFSPNGDILVSGSEDKSIKLWDFKKGYEIATLNGHSGTVYGIKFSPNGKLMVSSGSDSTIRIWDTETRREIAVIEGFYAPMFSSDANKLGAVRIGNTKIKIWDISFLYQLKSETINDLIEDAKQKYNLSLVGTELIPVIDKKNLFGR